ncbi:unnamed protein product [Pedinophyceae sp. YPF-701]|nr:unnamed protein product [Pedinophyceae sp. YPF-701]
MSRTSDTLYHMCDSAAWQRCCQAPDQPYFPPTYDADGFTHLTADPALLLGVANHFYTDVGGDWIVLCIDPSKLKAKVVFEAAAPVGDKPAKEGEQLFPHLYGGIDVAAVFDTMRMVRDPAGRFLSIEGL